MKPGTPTSGIETSTRYRRRAAVRRRAEQKSWDEQNGPVIAYRRTPGDHALDAAFKRALDRD